MTITAPAPATTNLDPRRWWTLAVLCLSLLIVSVANSSLNVAIPSLSEHFHATNSQLQWVVAVYSLVFAGLLFTAGALGDRFGRKGALQAGLFIFLSAALLAAFSSSIEQIIACRALMGVGAALIMPSTLSILVNVFPPHERTKAIAIWAATSGAAGAIGPVASGFLLGHFWFGAVFLVNVPIIVLALVSGHVLLPKSRDPKEAPLDPVAAVLSTVGLGSLVYGLIQAPEHGWASGATLLAFAVAVIVIVLFVVWELRQEDPMLDMSLFRSRAFSAGSACMALIFLAMFGVMFLITQYFQLVLGYSPLSAALRFAPMSPIMVVVATQTPKMSRRFGANRVVALGMSCIALALFMFRFLQVDTSYLYVFACIVPLTTGIAMSMSPMTASIMSAVPARRAGTGSAMNDTTRELGAALGVAVFGSLAASRYSNSISSALGQVPASSRGPAQSSLSSALDVARTLDTTARQALTAAADHAFISGIHFAVSIAACLAAIAAFAVYHFLPHQASHESAVESAEHMAELGVGGVMPLFEEGAGA
ncbi:MAG: drug resistance transporter, EmrB/QacA subfamily [Ilumatobacteraceae bacterium]|nr:drug resistance transporter, EmrB/QacA subfamily [Ilumatobacteraceae bacterium]